MCPLEFKLQNNVRAFNVTRYLNLLDATRLFCGGRNYVQNQ